MFTVYSLPENVKLKRIFNSDCAFKTETWFLAVSKEQIANIEEEGAK
jgi:hypothetical protein